MRNFIFLFCPLLTVKESFCGMQQRDYWYNVKRPHFGKGMDGRSPFEKLKDLGYNLPEEFALLPPIILDDVSTFWAVRGGNNLLTPYMSFSFRKNFRVS